jgi:hypothetical protein
MLFFYYSVQAILFPQSVTIQISSLNYCGILYLYINVYIYMDMDIYANLKLVHVLLLILY